MHKALIIALLLGSGLLAGAVEQTPDIAETIVPPTPEWQAKITSLAPEKPRVEPKAPRKVLVCSLATGYCHKVIPHVKEVMNILSATGAFEATHSDDIEMFTPDKLKEFDAVVLNNTCTKGPARNWFLDVLASKPGLTNEQQHARAAAAENSLIEFVANGKGLVAVHGAVVFLNQSENFSDLLGGSFVTHPKTQRITLTPVDPKHPLVKAFKGEAFIHTDEPYLFHKAYESSRMLQYHLDGLQYALGDLECEDAPIGK